MCRNNPFRQSFTHPDQLALSFHQVSVLKQALTEGEQVDVLDEAGLTALMWAARTGRLSTAKYLVSQGASLERRDEATGFSPLHFAAYYCRYSPSWWTETLEQQAHHFLLANKAFADHPPE